MSRTFFIPLHQSWDNDAVLQDLSRRLSLEGARELRTDTTAVAFTVPYTNRGGPLFIVTAGAFSIQRERLPERGPSVCCHLSFRRAAIVVAVLSFGWLGIGSSLIQGEYSGGTLTGTLLFCMFAYCWLLGAWFLVVPTWLSRRLELTRFSHPRSVDPR